MERPVVANDDVRHHVVLEYQPPATGPLWVCLGKFQQVQKDSSAVVTPSGLQSFYIQQSDGQFDDAD